MPRFFVSPENIQDNFINITGEDVNHITKVLRLSKGDKIVLCDGRGTDYTVLVDGLGADGVRTRIVGREKNSTEPSLEVTLFQGVPKSEKMDLIIQKSVELGVYKIVPVMTERTIVKIDSEKEAQSKAARWRRIAAEAAKQCNRGLIPRVELPVAFGQALTLAKVLELGILPYENERRMGLKSCLKGNSPKTAGVMIGPEGGFSEKEVERALQAGIRPVTLGPRILRTETAGIAALAILMYEVGDVGGPME